MARKIKFEKGKVYHIFNRGADKRSVFLDNYDRFRFVYDLFEFNDDSPGVSLSVRRKRINRGPTSIYKIFFNKDRKKIVRVLAFVLMNTHYHLLLEETDEGGVSKFLQKLSTGYTMYFNEKYNRSGVLFQGRFKAVEVGEDYQLPWTLFYIHFNPIELIEPKWKERKIRNKRKVLDFLNSYKWSSHLDYLGKINFPQVTQRDFLLSEIGGVEGYKKEFNNWLDEFDESKHRDLRLD